MDRRPAPRNTKSARRLLSIATASLVGLAPFVPTSSQASATIDQAAAPAPAIFDYPNARLGAFVALDEHNGFKERKAHQKFEKKWHRKSDFIREFVEWDEPKLFTKAEKQL